MFNIETSNKIEKLSSKALVYPSATIAGYGHIYSLSKAGIHTVALSEGICSTFYSRHTDEHHTIPDPREDVSAFVEWLLSYGKEQDEKPVLFFVEDLYAYLGSYHANELKEYYHYAFLEPETMDTFFDKKHMYTSIEDTSINVPETIYSPLTEDKIEDWSHFPAIVKPLVSRFDFEDGLRSTNAFPDIFDAKAIQIDDRSELADTVARTQDHDIDVCVQEMIPGSNKNIGDIKFVVDESGSIRNAFTSIKQRQYPPDFGTCALAKSVDLPELHGYAEAFCTVTGYHGPGSIEFKKSTADGKWYFIEINPRLDFWIRMAVLNDVNLPLDQYLYTTSNGQISTTQRTGEYYWLNVPNDLKGYYWRKKRRQWELSLAEFLRPYPRANAAVFNLHDPLPTLLKYGYKPVKKAKQLLPI